MPAKRKPQTRIVQKPRAPEPPKPAQPRWYPRETIADRLRKARAMSEYAGDMTTIPALMKISYATLTGWERGKASARRFPREALERLAQLYGCDAQWLITGTPSPDAVEIAEEESMAWERALSPAWADSVDDGSLTGPHTLDKGVAAGHTGRPGLRGKGPLTDCGLVPTGPLAA